MTCETLPDVPPTSPDALAAPEAGRLLPGFLALLPRGPAWHTDETARPVGESVLHRFWRAVAGLFAPFYARAWAVLLASGPSTVEADGITDWEEEFGLPGNCLTLPDSDDERRLAVRMRMSLTGRADIPYFECLAESIGVPVRIRELRPFVCGLAQCGAQSFGAPSMVHLWEVQVQSLGVVWFTFGQSQLGRDPLGRALRHVVLECLFEQFKPAHTQIIWVYRSVD